MTEPTTLKKQPVFIRIPAYTLGNTGDAALITTIQSTLNTEIDRRKHNAHVKGNNLDTASGICEYRCPMKKIRNMSRVLPRRYRGMIYFGNDCLAYYDVDTRLCQAFLNAGRPVVFINCSYGPVGTTKNDAVIRTLLKHPLCHLIARDEISHQEITQRLQPRNPVTLSADLVFAWKLPDLSSGTDDMLDDTPLQKWWRQDRHTLKSTNGHTLVLNLHEDFGSPANNTKVIDSVLLALTRPEYWIAQELRAGRLAIIFLAHDSRKPETEIAARVATAVRKTLHNQQYGERVLVCPCLDPTKELVMLKEGVDAVLTGRMHLSILGMRAGVPSTAIAYNGVKAQGTFNYFGQKWNSDSMGNGQFIVAEQGVLTVADISAERVDDVCRDMLERRRSEYLECIESGLPHVRNLAMRQIRTICEIFA